MFRLPIMVWNLFLTSFMVLVAFPVLSGALIMLMADRHFGAHFYEPASGGAPILWQHLFWFFGHPEVYIVALPFFGVATEIFPVFSRKPIFGYKGLVLATLTIAALSTSVWAHHMFVTGEVDLAFFAVTSMLIGVPTGVKVFNWIGSMWGGSLMFPAADAVRLRVPRHLRRRWCDGDPAGGAEPRLPRVRFLLRRRPLPLRDGWNGHLHAVRGDLLLVAEGDRADACPTGWARSTSGCC